MRVSDKKLSNLSADEFVFRKRHPTVWQIVSIFSAYFFVTLLSADSFGSGYGFAAATLLLTTLMALYTIVSIQRNSDLLLVVEFENSLFSAGLTMNHKFTLIVNREGTVVYMDPGLLSTIPNVSRKKHQAIDNLLKLARVSREDSEKIHEAIRKQSEEKIIFTMTTADKTTQKVLMSVEPLSRPSGFVILRARDFVEKRATGQQGSGTTPNVLLHIANKLPVGVYALDMDGRIEFANQKLEEMLGYSCGTLSASKIPLRNMLASSGQNIPSGDFEGEVYIHAHDGTPVKTYISQFRAPGQIGYVTAAMVYPLEERPHAANAEAVSIEGPVSASAAHSSVRLENYIARSPLAIARLDHRGFIVEANDAFQHLTQQTLRQRLPCRLLDIVHASRRDDMEAILREALGGYISKQSHALEFILPNGSHVMVSLYFSIVESQEGDQQLIVYLIDTTEQKNLEMRFAHSQKMQAVGQLAGGVAHDFNNLLTAMIGFCDLLLMRHPAGDQSFADIMQIKQNANRAANLVRQLLAFSRRQTLQPKMLDITDVLAELSNLVRRLIGENIELVMTHGRDLGMVKADQGQLEQVVINLAVNARDAMPGGGKLSIKTSRAVINRRNPLPRDLIAPADEDAVMPDGEYVLVDVIDTGTGIPPAIIQKIFEPFFSTKEVGSGTGLGLATVYGIIKQTGGHIFVSSAEGKGTRFAIFFPSHQGQERTVDTEAESAERSTGVDLTGKATILLVEDEATVRFCAARALRNKGYTVLEADSAETALDVMSQHGNQVEVIITDVIMPGMNGPTMIDQILPNHPNLKVIFISGYAEDAFLNSYGTERSFNFLPKPFTLKQLASRVKEITGGKSA